MYSAFKSLLDKLENNAADSINFWKEDPKIVLGVLFLIVIKADGRTRPEEIVVYHDLLDHFLEIGEDERYLFEQEVSKRMRAIPDLDGLMEHLHDLPESQKRLIIDYMRKISVSDYEFHEAELTVIARAAKLLGLSEQELFH